MRKTMKLMIIILVAIALLVALAIGAFARLASEKEKKLLHSDTNKCCTGEKIHCNG